MTQAMRERPDLGAPSLDRGGGDPWLQGSGRIANHLGWLARKPWPPCPPVTSRELGAVLARLARLRLRIVQTDATWSVRDAGAAITESLRRLGLQVAQPGDMGAPERGTLTFTICTPAAITRVVDALADAEPGCLVVEGVAREDDLARALPHLSRLRCVASTDPALVRLVHAAGTPALLWAPAEGDEPLSAAGLDDPLIAGLPKSARLPASSAEPWTERPLDILSIGPEGGVRAALLGAAAEDFARRACVLVHRRAMWRLGDEPILAEPTARHLFRRAKIVLNVQPGEASALDWSLGMLDAMALGALAVSTPCFPHPFLRKDVHYLEETPDRLPSLIDWLLDSPEGRRTADGLRAAAVAALASEANPAITAARLLRHTLAARERPAHA